MGASLPEEASAALGSVPSVRPKMLRALGLLLRPIALVSFELLDLPQGLGLRV